MKQLFFSRMPYNFQSILVPTLGHTTLEQLATDKIIEFPSTPSSADKVVANTPSFSRILRNLTGYWRAYPSGFTYMQKSYIITESFNRVALALLFLATGARHLLNHFAGTTRSSGTRQRNLHSICSYSSVGI